MAFLGSLLSRAGKLRVGSYRSPQPICKPGFNQVRLLSDKPSRNEELGNQLRELASGTGRMQISRRQRTAITNQLWVQRLASETSKSSASKPHNVLEKTMKDSYFEVSRECHLT